MLRNREDESNSVEGDSKKMCVSSTSQKDLFLSEPNQVKNLSLNSCVHSATKNMLQMEMAKRKMDLVKDDDPFAFPSDLIKHQPSKEIHEDMFSLFSNKPKQVKNISEMESKIKTLSRDILFVTPTNKGRVSRKCSVDMFASSAQSSKRGREENHDFSLHLRDNIELNKKQKTSVSCQIHVNNQQENPIRTNTFKKVKLDENDPFAFPNQVNQTTDNAVGDGFDFPVNIAVNNTHSFNHFDIVSQELSVREEKNNKCNPYQTDFNFVDQKMHTQQERNENKLVSSKDVKQVCAYCLRYKIL